MSHLHPSLTMQCGSTCGFYLPVLKNSPPARALSLSNELTKSDSSVATN